MHEVQGWLAQIHNGGFFDMCVFSRWFFKFGGSRDQNVILES